MLTLVSDTIKNEPTHPLYVRIPKDLHRYLDDIKDQTGISKSDTVTLILLIARRLIGSKTILELFDDYMINGDGVEILNALADSLGGKVAR